MKKILLVLGVAITSIQSFAQQVNVNCSDANIYAKSQLPFSEARSTKNDKEVLRSIGVGLKTTAGVTSRWYTYASEIFDSINQAEGNSTQWYAVMMWNDTGGKVNYTGGMAHNTIVSMASVLQPQHKIWDSLYPGELVLPMTKPYTVDSIVLYGTYDRNPAKPLIIDTLIITTTSGGTNIGSSRWTSGTILSNHGLLSGDTFICRTLVYDSVHNTLAHYASGTGSAPYTFKYLLDAATVADTASNGMWFKAIKLPVALNASAGELVGLSVSFKSGDPAFPANPAIGDTIEMFNGTHKYGIWKGRVNTKYDGSLAYATDHYARTAPHDWNEGLYKTLPNYKNGWDSTYIPQWAFGVSAPSYLQHFMVSFKVNCPSCDPAGLVSPSSAISDINAFPNPSASEINIKFNTVTPGNGIVTLSNSVGQVVRTQNISFESIGIAKFNTVNLPSGDYFYTITIGSERLTGKVLLTH